MGSSASKYVDRASSVRKHGKMDYQLPESLLTGPNVGEGENSLIPRPDSQLKSTFETSASNKAWGHNLIGTPTKEATVDHGDRPPYHDDYEVVLSSYTQEILPIEQNQEVDTSSKTASLKDMAPVEIPPCPTDQEADTQDTKDDMVPELEILTDQKPCSEDVSPTNRPRRPKPAFGGTLETSKAMVLRSIEEIRQHQHKRIMEQMRELYDARIQPPPSPPPPPVMSAEIERRRKALNIELDAADDLLDDLVLQDEALEQVPLKAMGSGGSQKAFRQQLAWTTQATRSSCEVIPLDTPRVCMNNKFLRPCLLASGEAEKTQSVANPEDKMEAKHKAQKTEQDIRALERTILDLEIL